jgi:hypothetical protein
MLLTLWNPYPQDQGFGTSSGRLMHLQHNKKILIGTAQSFKIKYSRSRWKTWRCRMRIANVACDCWAESLEKTWRNRSRHMKSWCVASINTHSHMHTYNALHTYAHTCNTPHASSLLPPNCAYHIHVIRVQVHRPQVHWHKSALVFWVSRRPGYFSTAKSCTLGIVKTSQ